MMYLNARVMLDLIIFVNNVDCNIGRKGCTTHEFNQVKLTTAQLLVEAGRSPTLQMTDRK